MKSIRKGDLVSNIQIINNLILYYGNKAGYIEEGKAVVDTLFKKEELISFLLEKKGIELQCEMVSTKGYVKEKSTKNMVYSFLRAVVSGSYIR